MVSTFEMVTALALLAAPPGPFGNTRHPVTREVRLPPTQRVQATPSSSASFLGTAQGFYRYVLSPIDGPRCSHRPTCSLYSREALARHGLVVGVWLTYDRLLRDARSSSVRRLPVRLEDARIVYLDPVTESTFWLP
ncbi:membrane protein insertion efficiency factor YidD [Archangium sp.]|jgi:hypothetical protein|uniref:membrane protein insertion efficiency factor YidD n=1 Tax=Archangium sp. TaxID=1872627 RepID=UPI002ED83545